jgi:tripartite ATP-independent transporter DctP family solute receptor
LAFKNYVEANSKGALEVSVHPLGQLGSEITMAEAIQTGSLEMGSLTVSGISNFIPQTGLMALPFFYTDKEKVERVWSGSVGAKIFSMFPNKGMYALSWGSNGYHDFANSKIPISSPADLRSIKVRSTESPIWVDGYKALGVNPVTLPWPEVFTALKQGVIDGIDLPYNSIFLAKTYEALKYITVSGWIYSGLFIVINKDFFDRLSPELKQVVKDGAYLCGRVNLSQVGLDEINALEQLQSKGIVVSVLNDSEKAQFRKLMAPVYEKYRKIIGENLFDEAVNAVK